MVILFISLYCSVVDSQSCCESCRNVARILREYFETFMNKMRIFRDYFETFFIYENITRIFSSARISTRIFSSARIFSDCFWVRKF